MWKANGRTTDAYPWQKLTWPMARWAKKKKHIFFGMIWIDMSSIFGENSIFFLLLKKQEFWELCLIYTITFCNKHWCSRESISRRTPSDGNSSPGQNESREDIKHLNKDLNHKIFFFIMIYFGKKFW
jgi:hypothetical protein